MERYPHLWIKRFNILKGNIPQIILQIQPILSKLQLSFHRDWQADTKIHREIQINQDSKKTVLTRRGFTFPNFNIF